MTSILNRTWVVGAVAALTLVSFPLAAGAVSAPEQGPSCQDQFSVDKIVSDTITLEDGSPAFAVASPLNDRWTATASIPGATWIWGEDQITNAVDQTSETFTRTFNIVGTPTGATLTIAADNTYSASVNGHPVCEDATDGPEGSYNYQSGGVDICSINAADLNSGANTLTVTVTNTAMEGGSPSSNPAGLLYKLIVTKNACVPVSTITVVAQKVVCTNPTQLPQWGSGGNPITSTTAQDWVNAEGHSSCSLVDGWNFEWANQGGGDAGDAYPGHAAGYTAFGPTVGGSVTTQIPLTGITEVHLREQLKSGYIPFTYNFASGEPTNNVYPSAQFYCSNDVRNNDNLDYIRNPIADTTYYCVAFNAPVSVPEAPTCNSELNLIANGSFETPDVANNSWNVFPSGFSGLAWIVNWIGSGPENRPTTANAEIQTNGLLGVTAVDGSQWTELDSDYQVSGNFTGGPASVSLKQTIPTIVGKTYKVSYYFKPRPDAAANQSKVEVLDGAHIGSTVDATAGAGWTQHNYTFTATGATTDITFRDAGATSNSLGALLDNVSVTCQPTTVVDPDCEDDEVWNGESCEAPEPTCNLQTNHLVEGVCTPNTCSDGIKNQNETSVDTGGVCAPESCPQGQHLEGNSCVTNPPTTTSRGGGGGGGSGCALGTHWDGKTFKCEPNVLGAFTGPQVLGAACGLYMDKHLKIGSSKNDTEQVKKLQDFLVKNGFGSFNVTGYFGPLTLAAVNAFQQKYSADVLTPWNINAPTGLVYLSTIRMINLLMCPDLGLTLPSLIPWNQNPNAQ